LSWIELPRTVTWFDADLHEDADGNAEGEVAAVERDDVRLAGVVPPMMTPVMFAVEIPVTLGIGSVR
jgi:hypothetical protein